MGANSCSPDKPSEEAPVTDMDKKAAREEAAASGQPGEKFTTILNQYQAENERLKKEVEELKTQESAANEQSSGAQEESSKLTEELEAMKALMQNKRNDMTKLKLETALHKRATTMLSAENAATLLIAANLEKFGKAGRGNAKPKFVEVQLHKGEHTQNGFEPGVIRLHYAESKESSQRSTGRVTKVSEAKNVSGKYQERTFAITAQIEGSPKELVFACADAKQREEWVKAFMKGFAAIKQEVEDMNKEFQLKLEFSKPKLGIRVEEKVITNPPPAVEEQEKKEEEPKEETNSDEAKPDADSAPAAEDIPAPAEDTPAEDAPAEDAPAYEEGEPAAEAAEPAAAEEPAVEEPAAEEPAVEAKEEEPACTLVVTAISDDAIKNKGLVENMSLVALNDTTLDGMPYSKQLALLTKTEKPFYITFSGPTYLKKATAGTTAYPEILKQLLADVKNNTQAAFNAIISGTSFAKELATSDEPKELIKELLHNQRKLTLLLHSVTVHVADL